MSSNDDQLVADYLRRLAAAAASLPPDRRDELIEEISAHIAEARAANSDATGEAGAGVADTLTRLGEPNDIVRAAAEQTEPGQSGTPTDSGLTGREAIGAEPSGIGGGYVPGGSGPGGAYPGWRGDYGTPMPAASRMGVLEIAAVILLLIGGFLAGIGWIVGVVLLWISPRWRLSDKLLGTLIWPSGIAGVLFVLGAAAGGASLAGQGACSDQGARAALQVGSAEPVTQSTAQHCTSAPGTLPGWLGVTLVFVAVVAGIGGPILVAIRLVRQARREQQAYPATA